MTEPRKKITLPYLFKKVADGEPITWLTCYDYPTAYLPVEADIPEMLFVAESTANNSSKSSPSLRACSNGGVPSCICWAASTRRRAATNRWRRSAGTPWRRSRTRERRRRDSNPRWRNSPP